ncbi:amidohydrolase family protein [Leptospira levettii]|uniref:adenosine deaminase n=1 Tax=Leptospira levettii TaxID=2023178 RepID=UPI00223D18F1|nr:adenosine deaminase [Leptospira levettii]MCW7474126.1 adenosine deaminase [Leptospira levettii]
MYIDLHNHLYGCLPPETLFRIGKNNPNPRWHLYLESYEKAYGIKIRPSTFFDDYSDIKEFSKLYHFKEKAPFLHFQAKFNLIIALVKFDEREITEVSHDVVYSNSLEDVSYAEYRLMFGKEEPKESFYTKLMASLEGLKKGEESAKKAGKPIQAKLVMSLHRDLNFERHYDWMKNWMEKESVVRDGLVGIDFCHIEESFPPKDKRSFFHSVNKDNKAEPKTALSILYHVGESFRDKTPFSAVRWIIESAENGAHRLGHALALGIDSDYFLGEERTELVSEAKDQIEHELMFYDEITTYGPFYAKEELELKRKEIKTKPDSEILTIPFDETQSQYLHTFQNYAMSKIAKTNVVIECCPSSNLYIGMLESHIDHPITRFLQNDVKITIGSDDPGLFGTTMEEEYQHAHTAGVSEKDLELIRSVSLDYRSTKLSGRDLD